MISFERGDSSANEGFFNSLVVQSMILYVELILSATKWGFNGKQIVCHSSKSDHFYQIDFMKGQIIHGSKYSTCFLKIMPLLIFFLY